MQFAKMKNKKKKILVLYQDWGNWFVNDYSVFEHWFKGLDGGYNEHNEYYIFSLGNYDKSFQKEKNVYVELFKSTPKRQFADLFKYRKRLKEIIKEFEPDYVYSPFIYLLSTVLKSEKYEIIGFLRERTAYFYNRAPLHKKFFANIFYVLDFLAMKKIDILLYNSKELKKYALKLGYKDKFQFCTRPLLDLNQFSKNKQNKIIKKYSLENKKIILTVARLSPEKNLDIAIKTLKYLPENYVYIIIGMGSEEERLKTIVLEDKLAGRVIFINQIKHKELWNYYKIAKIFWLISSTEGRPNVIQEAFYAKLPCVVSNIKPFKELIADGNTGLIIKEIDSRLLADNTLQLISNKKKYNKIKLESFKEVKKIMKYNLELKSLFK